MTRHIALLAYPDCQLLDVSGPWQVFASANALSPEPLYRLTLAADAPGQVMTNGGLAVHASHTYAELPQLLPLESVTHCRRQRCDGVTSGPTRVGTFT